MPRCQRSFKRLTPQSRGTEPNAVPWRCSFCAEAEEYETVQDSDLLSYARLAYTVCTSDFGMPSDSAYSTRLIWGVYPECVREPGERCYDLYLQRGGDPMQLRLQIGHETFHRVCSQGRVFHWSHEMLACLFSVRALRRAGFDIYAEAMEDEYARQAVRLSVAEMRGTSVDSPPYPPGLYGRAYQTGRSLEAVVGWTALCRLARCLDRTQMTPDVIRWLHSLPNVSRNAAASVLGITNK